MDLALTARSLTSSALAGPFDLMSLDLSQDVVDLLVQAPPEHPDARVYLMVRSKDPAGVRNEIFGPLRSVKLRTAGVDSQHVILISQEDQRGAWRFDLAWTPMGFLQVDLDSPDNHGAINDAILRVEAIVAIRN